MIDHAIYKLFKKASVIHKMIAHISSLSV